MELSANALSQIGGVMDQKIAAVLVKVEKLDKRMDAQDQRLDALEAKVDQAKQEQSQGKPSTSPGGLQPNRFIPSYIEIKNLCDFNEKKQRASQGMRLKDWWRS